MLYWTSHGKTLRYVTLLFLYLSVSVFFPDAIFVCDEPTLIKKTLKMDTYCPTPLKWLYR